MSQLYDQHSPDEQDKEYRFFAEERAEALEREAVHAPSERRHFAALAEFEHFLDVNRLTLQEHPVWGEAIAELDDLRPPPLDAPSLDRGDGHGMEL